MQDTLKLARGALRFDKAQASINDARVMQVLAEYQSSHNAREAKAISSDPLGMPADALEATPSEFGICVTLKPFHAEQATKALAWSHCSREADLAAELENSWLQAHATIMSPAGAPPRPEVPKASECLAAGFCLCAPAGKRVTRLARRLVDHMKKRLVQCILVRKASS